MNEGNLVKLKHENKLCGSFSMFLAFLVVENVTIPNPAG